MEEVAEQSAGQSQATEQLLPLDLPERAVVLGKGSHKTTHFFRRLKAKDGDGFASRIESEIEQRDGEMIRAINVQSACLWLYQNAVIRVEGYRLEDGRPIMELPNWKERIPRSHAIRAVNLLTDISFSRPEFGCVVPCEGDLVFIDARWTADESGTGMQKYAGLKHYFASASVGQHDRFNRARNKVAVVGDRRHGRTIFPSPQPLFVSLYDELIQRVEGYSVGGRALGGRDEIIREMDVFHKCEAARGLFESDIDDSAGAEEDGKN
jgi:hypothetical protein